MTHGVFTEARESALRLLSRDAAQLIRVAGGACGRGPGLAEPQVRSAYNRAAAAVRDVHGAGLISDSEATLGRARLWTCLALRQLSHWPPAWVAEDVLTMRRAA